jgi:Arc/MetJ-type ribon-helix-helix transcriptional regulator
MPQKGYRSITLPDELIERVDKAIQAKKLGYVSATDFIRESIRMRLDSLDKEKGK